MTPSQRGIALMVSAMAAFALGDLGVKIATGFVSPAQGVVIMASFGTLLFAALCLRAGVPLISPALWRAPVLLRNVTEGLTAICFFSAMAAAPMSLLISITQAVPLLVTLGAATLLKEPVGPRRWTAIGIGLCGVIVMLRPWEAGLAPGAVFALFAALGLATRDLAARFVPPQVPTLQLALWGTASLIPAGLLLLPFTEAAGAPPLPIVATLALASLAAGAGYYMVTAAMRIGDVSAVAPFRYTRLLFALVLAVLFLGERPDLLTLMGALIVIASGLFVFLRERSLRQASPPPL